MKLENIVTGVKFFAIWLFVMIFIAVFAEDAYQYLIPVFPEISYWDIILAVQPLLITAIAVALFKKRGVRETVVTIVCYVLFVLMFSGFAAVVQLIVSGPAQPITIKLYAIVILVLAAIFSGLDPEDIKTNITNSAAHD